MNQALSEHKFPLISCMLALSGVALVVGAGASYGVPVGLEALLGKGQGGSFESCVAMALVVWLSGLLGVLPVSLLGRGGVMGVVRGWFIGTGLKLLVSITAGVILIKVWGYQLNPVMLTLALMYLAMLPVSMFFVLNYLRAKDNPNTGDSGLAMETSV